MQCDCRHDIRRLGGDGESVVAKVASKIDAIASLSLRIIGQSGLITNG